MDWTIELHRHPDFPEQIVVEEKYRAFFGAAKVSLAQAVTKIDQITPSSTPPGRPQTNWNLTLEGSNPP